MSRDLDDVSTERLEAHFRARISPEIVEWFRRQYGELLKCSPLTAECDAAFGAVVGSQNTIREIIEDLERLLTETNDQEDT